MAYHGALTTRRVEVRQEHETFIPHVIAVTRGSTVALPHLPAGDYTLVGWHERVGERIASVRVERGRAVRVDLSLPVEDAR